MTNIRPLDLDSVDQLGPRARTCVYWQTDGRGDEPTAAVGDPEFEKEAWISRVSLEWGVCGQHATFEQRPAGAAVYAPPAMVPRAECFPTSPVGSDAILLAGLTEEQGAPAGLGTALLAEVVADLRSRGVKAIEAFGVTSGDPGPIKSRDGCGSDSCVPAATFLIEHGFTVVAEHETHPRLRLDIDSDHLWKADVERALDQLFAEHGFATRRVGELSGATALGRPPD
ncbi:MAG TPA: hypothetical protein H9759_00345 [Candidatus Dietzia intestinipullorum]|nr:hypothetical protein [Candidatus Dietzia intestinipullorum]